MKKLKHLSLDEVSHTIMKRTGSNHKLIETILHYHWRIIIHTLRHHRSVEIDDYLVIHRQADQFVLDLTPKIKAYLE